MHVPARILVLLALATGGLCYAAPKEDSQLICRAKISRPQLDYEFRFYTYSEFLLPFKQFCDAPVGMDSKIRIESLAGSSGEPAVLTERLEWSLQGQNCRKGQLFLPYEVWTGIGRYRASWEFHDELGRSCHGSDEFTIALARNEREIAVGLRPGTVVDNAMDLFQPEPGIDCSHLSEPRRLKVFINTDVVTGDGFVVETTAEDLRPHLAALRRLAQSEMFNQFSLVAFSFEEQGIVAWQDYEDTIDFPRLGESIHDRNLYGLDVDRFVRRSSMSFLTSLLSVEVLEGDPPDAVAFIGHDANVVPHGKRFPDFIVNQLHSIGGVFIFMTPNRWLQFRGVMGSLVHRVRGEYHILRNPRDIAVAVSALEELAIESGLQ